MDPNSSVSHVILTRISTRVFACKNLCYRYIRIKKKIWGFELRTSHTSCSCLTTELTRRVTGQNPPGHVPPDTYPKDTYPLVTYPLDTYPLGHIPPRTYTPQTLKCPIWFMHHLLITYCTLKNIYFAGIAFCL